MSKFHQNDGNSGNDNAFKEKTNRAGKGPTTEEID